ncbi:HPr family phosphocarrier protein [Glycocaulis sp.]|uniref:HPr family phosphocarrier protein n=1 Tax=Glycocaulis sp. TaxID=1969725 RepID=UPI0025C54141|nr:HPr family phosphocarrier protein [Glycocaulis sp.]MCH8520893.1 HPr family phosphocarrier protein [Glycocaulis sp.]
MNDLTAQVMIVNKRGLHARAAAKFVGLVRAFEADIDVSRDEETVDGRSIMDLLMLGAGPGTRITINARGLDAAEALAALKALVESGFEESE